MTSDTEGAGKVRKVLRKGSFRKTIFILAIGMLVAFAANFSALAIDAPHDAGNTIGCTSCHGGVNSTSVLYSMFWSGGAADETAFSNLCAYCHNKPSGGPYTTKVAPLVQTHSSTTTSTKYGSWSNKCVACHDPHAHEFKTMKGIDSELKLMSGIVDAYAVDTPSVGYSELTIRAGYTLKSGWTEAKIESKSLSERGVIIWPNKNKMGVSFTVHKDSNLAANKIVIKGDIRKVYNAWAQPPTYFFIIYGQGIKELIDTDNDGIGDAPVIFTDRTGPKSFAHNDGLAPGGNDSTVDGICQVCHTQTDHFRNDGSRAATTTHVGRSGVDCMGCHSHESGFAGGGGDHSTDLGSGYAPITVDGSCGACHTAEPSVGIHVTGANKCDNCHTSQIPTLNGVALLKGAVSGQTNSCSTGPASCHAPINTSWYNHESSAANHVYSVDHTSSGLSAVLPPSAPTTNIENCTSANCHSGAVITVVHDVLASGGSYSCQQCHDVAGALIDGGNGYGDARLGAGGGAECLTCHGAYFPSHTHHTTSNNVSYNPAGGDTSQPAQKGCAGTSAGECHQDNTATTASLNNWAGIFAEHDLDGTKNNSTNNCANCHAYDDSASAPQAAVEAAIASGGAVNCQDCHTDKVPTTSHGGHVPTAFPWDGGVAESTCGATICHDAGTNTDVVGNIHGGDCTVCHSNSSGGDGTTKVGSATNGVDGNATLGSTGTPHTDNCLVCHPAVTYPMPTVHHDSKNNYAANGQCSTCHSSGHTTMVQTYVNCSTCHTATGNSVNASDPKVHDGCTACHNQDGSLKGSAAGHAGGGGTNDGGGACNVCHGEYFGSHTNANHAGRVDATGTGCNSGSCHTATAGTTSGIPTSSSDVMVHDSCATCHTATGVLVAPGSGAGRAAASPDGGAGSDNGGGLCTACHTGQDASSHISEHNNAQYEDVSSQEDISLQGQCATCHDAMGFTNLNSGHVGRTIGTADINGSGAGTQITCNTCHTSTVQTVITAIADGKAGSGISPISCADCHGARTLPHGGHTIVDFPWDAGTLTSCGTASCHNGAVDSDVPNGVHGGVCTVCHDNANGGNGTTIVGSATNGIDGNAQLGSTATPHTTDTCNTCHPSGTYPLPAIHHDSKNNYAANGQCSVCHSSAHTTMVQTYVNCSTCHTATGNSVNPGSNLTHDGCTACHNQDGSLKGSASGHEGGAGTNDGGGACNVCHGEYFNSHSSIDHSARVAADTNCTGCHTGTTGTILSSGSNLVHDTCQTCHAATGVLVSDPGNAPGISSAGASNNCTLCHGATYFNSHEVANHSTGVAVNTDCTGCHTATAGTASGVPVAPADPKIHDSCQTCHQADGTRVGVQPNAPGMTANGGDCKVCHGAAYFNSHEAADHSGLVDATATGCNSGSCHTATAGTASGIPTDGADVLVHDACTTCHDTAGVLKTVLAADTRDPDVITAMPAGAAGSDNGGGLCTVCHTSQDATNHESEHNNAQYEDVSSQEDGSIQGTCNNCHNAMGFTNINSGHVGRTIGTADINGSGNGTQITCNTCHTSTVQTVITAIADGKTGSGISPISCADCHGPRTLPHGGHTSVDFPWDAGTLTSCGTASCHNGAVDSDVPNAVHGGTCTVCHDNANGGDGTTIVGSATNGIDGNAQLGSTATPHTTDTCNTCHPSGTYPLPTIHHDSKNNYAANGQCSVCHSSAHTTMVQTYGNCSTCHTATGNSVNATNNKTHDGCTTCHNQDGSLKSAYGNAIAIPAGGAGSNDGGGTCLTCHGEYFGSHSNINHGTQPVQLASNCADCHTATAGTATGIPTAIGDNKVHDACSTCHATTGVLKAAYGVAQAMPNGGNDGGVNGGGTCETCHTSGFTGYHATVGHTTTVNTYVNCSSCHTATAGTTSGMPTASGDPKVHDACTVCHGADGRLVGSASGNNGGSNGGSDATNNCSTCHGEYFDSHAVINHSGTVDATATGCDSCHTATAGTASGIPLDPAVNATANKVHDACSTCHQTTGILKAPYGVAIAMPDNSTAGGTDGGGTCNACHGADYFGSHTTADHSLTVNSYANCSSCHTGTAGTASGIPTASGDNKVHDSCDTCHEASGALKTLGAANVNGYLTAMAGGNGDCSKCHGEYFDSHENINHGTQPVQLASNCADCHNGTQGTASGIPTAAGDNKVHDACSTCHATTGVLKAPYGVAQAMPNGGNDGGVNGGGTCETCHTSGFTGYHATVGHSTTVNTYVNCSSCHTATAGTASGIPIASGNNKVHDACTVCHGADGRLVGSASGNNGGSNGGSDASNNCSTCHGEYFDSHSNINHLTQTVQLASNCADCHTATAGTATGIPTAAGDNKVHDACADCHATTGVLKAAYGVAQAMPDNSTAGGTDGGGTCETCHTSGFTGYHATVGHTTTVNTYVNCSSCHTATAGTASGIPIASGNNKVHDACTVCHGADGRLVGSASGNNGGSNGGSDATNNCSTCHGEYFDSHAVINHSGTVDATATGCDSCHTATAGTASGIPTNNGVNKVHDSCSTCHATTGVLLTVVAADTRGIITAMPDNSTTGGTDGGGTCNACHGADYFGSHTTADHSLHIATYVNCNSCHAGTVGTASGIPTSAVDNKLHDSCDTCHQSTGTLKDYATANVNGYLTAMVGGDGDCSRCHGEYFDSHSNINHGTQPVQLASNCADCHTATAGTATGIPTATGDNKVHDACSTCHAATGVLKAAYGVAQAMPNGGTDGGVNGGGTCETCHTSGFTGYHATVGHTTTVNTYVNCSTCHTATAGTASGIPIASGNNKVHDACTVCHGADGRLVGSASGNNGGSNGGSDASNNCSTCHGEYFDSHSNINHLTQTVQLATNCADCHTATAGTATGIPTATGDNKVHDACSTCHATTGVLKVAYGVAQAMPDNSTAGGTDGGGTCETCHTSGFTGYHSTVGHSTTVNTYVNCSSCHTATAGTASGIPIASGNNKVHDACTVCHGANGRLVGSATGNNGGSNGGSDASNTCATCHGEYFDSHAVINHSGTVDATATGCDSCHTATAGTASGIPLDPAVNTTANKVHDACADCHQTTGILKAPYGYAVAMPDNSTAGGTDGGGVCTACHGAYFPSHTTANHTLTVNSLTTCTSSCHTATAGTTGGVPVDPATPAGDKVHDACTVCHAASGALLSQGAANVNGYLVAGAMAGGAANCGTCHGSNYFNSHVHGTGSNHDLIHKSGTTATDDISQDGAAGKNCYNCHNDANLVLGSTALSTWAAILQEHETVNNTPVNGCETCHNYATNGNQSGDPNTPLLADVTGAIGSTGNTCITCHQPKSYFVSPTTSAHGGHDDPDTFVTEDAACTNCHDSQANKNYITDIHARRWNGFNPPVTSNCQVCHQAAVGGGALQDYDPGGGPITGDVRDYGLATGGSGGSCLTCHNTASPFSQPDDFEAATTGQAGGSTFGNWTEQTASDGTTQWMAWTGATATAESGPTAASSGSKYVVLESSPLTGGGAGLATMLNSWSNPANGAASPVNTTYNVPASSGSNQRLLVVAVGVNNAVATANTFTVTYNSQTLTAITSNTNMVKTSAWIGYLKEASLPTSGSFALNVTVTGSPSSVHVHAITLDGVEQTGNPYTNIQNTGANKAVTLPTLTVGEGDQALVFANKDAVALSTSGTGWTWGTATGVVNLMDSITAYRTSTTAGDTSVELPGITNGGQGKDGSIVGVSIKAAAGGGGDFDATNGSGAFLASSTHYLQSGTLDVATYTMSVSFDWHMYMQSNDNATAKLYLEADTTGGGNWVDLTGGGLYINSTIWQSAGPYNLDAYTNAGFKLRFRYVAGSGTTWENDVAVDNISITGSLRAPTVYHPAAPDHSGRIATVSNCATTCHTASTSTTIISATHDLASAGGQAPCNNCHTSASATVIAAIYDAFDYGTQKTCATCHEALNTDFSGHTANTHNLLTAPADSALQSNDCDDCHTESITSALGTHDPTNAGGYTSCANCHSDPDPTGGSDGSLIGSALANHTVGAGSDCMTCHGATYFSSGANHSGETHSVAIDGDVSNGQPCSNASCHQGESENWNNILTRHDQSIVEADVCKLCHDSARTLNTTGGLGVQAVINSNVRGAAIVSCLECHSDRSAQHGGHDNTHFGWSGNCSNCHGGGSGTEPVVGTIHNNDCTLCHQGSNSAATNWAGPATNGIDGDAKLAEGAAIAGTPFNPATYNCTLCHAGATGSVQALSIGGIHHNNAGAGGQVAYTPSTNCTTAQGCHSVPGHGGNHSALIADAPSNCVDCHTGTAGTAGGAPISTVDNQIHDDCATCHQFDTTPATDLNGILVSSWPNGKGVSTMSDSTPLTTTDGGGNCQECHTGNWTTLHTNGTDNSVFDHSTGSRVTADTNCTTCHNSSAAAPDANTTPYTAGSEVHSLSKCDTCHTSNAGTILAGYGQAPNMTSTGGNCSACHGTYFPNHLSVDHSAKVSGLSSCTSSCHTATAGTTGGIPLDATDATKAAWKVHDLCATCHNTTSGALLVSGSADTHNPDWIKVSGYPTSGSQNCGGCHGSDYFGSHVQGYDTAGYVTHDVAFSSTIDRSQESDTDAKACYWCHDDASLGKGGSALSTWASIKTEHSTVAGPQDPCDICHNYATNGNQSGDAGTPASGDVTFELGGGTGVTNCVDCHVPKDHASGASSTHGGHSGTDFPWSTTAKTTCGTASCHDWNTNGDVVVDIHNGNCLNCHTVSPGSDGTATDRTVGFATNANLVNGSPHPEECSVCHTLALSATHHNKAGGNAANGDCHLCHTDPRPAAGQVPYQQLACRECHVKAYGGSGIEITDNVIRGGAITGANGTMTGNLQNTISSNPHQFANTASINNYGACFYCHGQTGVGAGRATKTVEPMHALPTPSTARTNLGTSNVLDTNLMGGGGYAIDNTASPNIFPPAEFQGASPTGYSTIWNAAYYPMGKERLNIGWALISQSKKAANAGDTKENNAGIITNAIFNIPAGMNFGTVVPPHDSPNRHFMPHFDTTPGTLGVDTLNGSADSTWGLAAAGTGPVTPTNRSIIVNVTSSDNTATLRVVYGGRVVWTGTNNGTANTTIDIGAIAATITTNGHQHSYASAGTGVVFVVSDRGGSIKLQTATAPGQGLN